ncbi:magnesium and cobalt transport protein CorA [Actinoplanes sp. N902-109]|uniref:magnesium and cobalt transport protein CorA n=1 Tax=Actinoplanes sp. (strain N902-109) TaxID=649831 RepID=UPI0003294CF3|nr:magnesium and cobalt transport protein CorA [Actinoplanes sp. N902-109]AGL14863.1 Mg2+ transporter corA [Actinoplanes sp. N902-109]
MFGWRREPYAIPRALGRLIEGLSRHRGEAPQQRRRHNPGAVVDCAVYHDGDRQPGRTHYADAAQRARRRRDAFVWLGLHEPDEATMVSIARVFGLHELTAVQAAAGGHRPAVETVGEVTRLVLRTARYVEHEELTATSEVVDTGDVTVLVGPGFVITVRHGAAGALSSVRQELEARPALLAQGPWAVVHAVSSRMVDLYLEVAGQVERDLELVEATAFAPRGPDIAHIYQLKREMVEFKRAVLPLQDPLLRLLDRGVVPDGLHPYLVDVRGRLARAVERVAGFDDLINSILQARLAQVSVDQNNDMRKIASWAAIAAVQTAIAGVYGMNFADLPGLNWKYGYPVVLLTMVVAAVALHRRLKKVGWL